jgi:hypothetical protein
MLVGSNNYKIAMIFWTAVLITFLSPSVSLSQSSKWNLDNLEEIGGHRVEVLGQPKVIKTDNGKAIEFDGVDDGIFIETNPLAGAKTFTIEAFFRPDADGPAEQRWLHIEDLENVESRALLETRVSKDLWFLDTFLKSGDNRLPLYAENFKHPTGRWYHVALVYDGTEMRHYIDGKLELSGKIAMKPFGRGRVSIGVRQNKVYWFKGAVRKVRFSRKALVPKQFLE